MPPKISILIPVLNGMPYLDEAFESLQNQTFKDFEVIVWDNGSTDGSVETISRWIPKILPGKVIVGIPLPLSECLEALVNESQSEFSARFDADDVCLPERLEKQVRFLDKNPNVVAVGGQLLFTDSAGVDSDQSVAYPTTHNEIVMAFLVQNPMAHPAVTFRTASVKSAGNYVAQKPVEDYELWLRLAQEFELANLDTPVLRYRRHENAVCGDGSKPRPDIAAAMTRELLVKCKSLHGLSPQACQSLREQKNRCAVFQLFKVSRHITGKTIPALKLAVKSVSQFRILTSSRDRLSKAIYRTIALGR